MKTKLNPQPVVNARPHAKPPSRKAAGPPSKAEAQPPNTRNTRKLALLPIRFPRIRRGPRFNPFPGIFSAGERLPRLQANVASADAVASWRLGVLALKPIRAWVALGLLLVTTVPGQAATRYVWQGSPSPGPPYDTWANAAHDIQTAVDAAVAGEEVLVTNGVYPGGVSVTNPLTLRSVNGPELTVIDGGGSVRCVYLACSASLSGFTLANGYCGAGDGGGGVFGGTLYNCVLAGNWAEADLFSSARGGGACGSTLYNCALVGNWASGWLSGEDTQYGGGAYGCTLYNCTLSDNHADDGGGGAADCTLYNSKLTSNSAGADMKCGDGGGAYGCTLYNCTLSGNSAQYGGGACGGTLNNCIVYFNGGNYDWGCTLNSCCTTPMPARGIGNITNAPLFVDYAGGDLRLLPNSLCIDAGTNLTGFIATDLLGLPRPMDGNNDGVARFDIGAYEFNPYRFEPALHLSADGFWFTVRGEPGRSVRIERSPDLMNWEYAGEVPIPACGQTLIDPAATTEPQLFYRAKRVP